MSAVRKAAGLKRPPTFRTSEYVDVDIDIDPDDLEAAGWVYVGKAAEGQPTTTETLDVVRSWHDETHPTNWRWCPEEPCHSLNREQGTP